MGVKQDFPKLLKTLSGGKIVIKNNSELKNRMWALDISIWMYQALSLKEIWSDAIMVPSVPMTKVVAIIMKKLDILKKWGITVLVVLDGSRNPKKAQTNKSRADAAELPKQTVEEMRKHPIISAADTKKFNTACSAYKNLRQDIMSDLIKALKLANIPFVNAAFEAEVQCVSLEKQGLVAGCYYRQRCFHTGF
jgi:5'-3' exonuclease